MLLLSCYLRTCKIYHEKVLSSEYSVFHLTKMFVHKSEYFDQLKFEFSNFNVTCIVPLAGDYYLEMLYRDQ